MRGAAPVFHRSCMKTYCEDGKPSPTKQTSPFCKPQEIAFEKWRLGERSGKDDRLLAVDEDPVLDMPPHGPGENDLL